MLVEAIEHGRVAFERHAWTDAYTRLSAIDGKALLDPEDVARLATAAYLIGRDAESAELWTRAHNEFLARGRTEPAVRCAFWLAVGFLHQGEHARAGGWLARARRLLDDGAHDCVERGYLLLPVAIRCIGEGDAAAAQAAFAQAAAIAERFGEPDLLVLARHGIGRCLIRQGRVEQGIALLDEAMAAIEAGDVSPLVVGNVYCSVIEACVEIFDLRRAGEWTGALTHWCESHPDLVPYRGQCLVYRAEILQLHGEWPDAAEAAREACERFLAGPPQPATGAAFYQRGELHRLHGAFGRAEEAYREASRWGRTPQPGLALLRLAQGETDAAAVAVRGALEQARQATSRTKLLPAYVDIVLAAGDLEAARGAAEELSAIAATVGAPMLVAAADQALGAVLLETDDASASLPPLRRALTTWQEIAVPYEAARARVLLGRALRRCGDHDAAELELDAACWQFRQLGALPDLARASSHAQTHAAPPESGLTRRELQVLRLIATGRTNRSIGEELFISEKTVARHVSNIFMKLGLSTRAAAAAYAHRKGLV